MVTVRPEGVPIKGGELTRAGDIHRGFTLVELLVVIAIVGSCFDSASTSQMAARSLHTGGVHVLMVAGAARFVSNDVDSKGGPSGCGPGPHGVWQALHTRAGGEAVDDF